MNENINGWKFEQKFERKHWKLNKNLKKKKKLVEKFLTLWRVAINWESVEAIPSIETLWTKQAIFEHCVDRDWAYLGSKANFYNFSHFSSVFKDPFKKHAKKNNFTMYYKLD